LDRANYRRKPRGGHNGLDPRFSLLLSLCCSSEGCRRRVTPPSVRFFGRRVYFGIVVVLSVALRQSATPQRMKTLHDAFGVDRRTVERWAVWWRETFAKSGLSRALRGLLPPSREPVPRWIVVAFNAEAMPDAQARMMTFIRSSPI